MNGHETGRRSGVVHRSGMTGLVAAGAVALALAVSACGGGSSGGGTTSAKTAATATGAAASTSSSSSTTIATATNLANQPAPTVPSSSSAGGGSKSAGGAGGAVAAGKAVFQTTCGGCHTLADAKTAGHNGPDLDQLKPDYATVHHQVINGGGGMPAFGKSGQLSAKKVTEVAKYVSSVAGKK